jgi:hypothetical protein
LRGVVPGIDYGWRRPQEQRFRYGVSEGAKTQFF